MDPMRTVIAELRREVVTTKRERDINRKKYEDTLEQWTKDQATLRTKLKASQQRERMLVRLLGDYLAGDIDDDQASKRLRAVN